MAFNSFHTSSANERFLAGKAVKRIGVISLFTGVAVLIGWVFNIKYVESVIPGMVAMKVNSAICFVLLGGALIVKSGRQNELSGGIYRILLLLVSLIGAITLLEYQLHFDARIDQLFVTDHLSVTTRFPFPGRMAYNTAASFILLGTGLFGLTTRSVKFHIIFQYFLHAVTVISGIAIMGYIYGVSMLYKFSYVSSMAIHTAILLLLLSTAAALLNPNLGVARLFTGSGVGNRMARRHFTTLMLVLIFFGSLRIQRERFHILPPEVGISLLAISLLMTSLIMIWMTSNWLNKVDNERSKAEEEIRNINTDLEIKVEERSAKLRELYTELKKSEERYRSLFEHASDAIYVLSNAGDFMDVNDSVCNMTGYSREELLKMNITSLLNTELLKSYPLIYTEIEPGRSVIAERKIIKKEGSVLDVEINIKKFVDERILVIARDVTERKKIEAELMEAELKFRTLSEKSMVGVYIGLVDRFTYVNPKFAEIFGYEPEEILDMRGNISDMLFTKESSDIVMENVRARHSGKADSAHYEVTGIRKDGTTRSLEFYGNTVSIGGQLTIIGTMLDITERKMMETGLREAELKFRTVAEKSMLGVYITQNKKFLYVNPRFAEIFGYTCEELMDLSTGVIDTIYAEESRAMVREKIRARDSGETEGAHYEAIGLKKDGTRIDAEFYGNRVTINGQPAAIGTALDITKRKKVEDELKTSEQKYKLLFENNPLPLWIVAKDDMTVIAANNAAAKLYGYTPEELLHMDIKKLRSVDHWDKLLDRYQANLKNATDFGVIEHIKKDGTEILVNIIAQDIMFEGQFVRLSSTRDVTSKLKAQEALKTSEANLQTILNNTDTAYALLNANLDIIEYNNKAQIFAKNEFNFELGGRDKVFDHIPEERRSQFMVHTKQVFDGQAISYEASYPQADDSVLWYYIRMFPIADKANKILGLVLAITDITERKEAEQNLQTAYQSIRLHIDKIREMTWKQSHLIRSPLANLKGLFPLVKDDPENKEVLEFIEKEIERMDQILCEMAQASSMTGNSKPVEPNI